VRPLSRIPDHRCSVLRGARVRSSGCTEPRPSLPCPVAQPSRGTTGKGNPQAAPSPSRVTSMIVPSSSSAVCTQPSTAAGRTGAGLVIDVNLLYLGRPRAARSTAIEVSIPSRAGRTSSSMFRRAPRPASMPSITPCRLLRFAWASRAESRRTLFLCDLGS